MTDGKGNPAMWTVILGNNNTGKTTLLRCLALLESEYEDGGYSPRLTYFLPTSANAILSEIESTLNIDIDDVWSYSEENFRNALAATYTEDDRLANLIIDAYGTQRKEGKGKFLGYKLENRTESLFKDDVDSIINAEEWFLGIDYNALKGGQKFSQNLLQIKTALISILPDIKDIEINEDGERRVHFITNTDEKVLVNQLGSGYQSLVTWIVDFAKRMFDRYPKAITH